MPTAKFWEKTIEVQASKQQPLKDRLVNLICRELTEKFLEMPVHIYQIIILVHTFLGGTRTMTVTTEEIHLQILGGSTLMNQIHISEIMGTTSREEHSPSLVQ